MPLRSRAREGSELPEGQVELLLCCSVDKQYQEKEYKYVNDVSVKFAVMHTGKEIGDSSRCSPHRLQDEPVHDMDLLALSVNGRPKMYRNRLTRVLDDVWPKDGLKDYTDGIGEAGWRVCQERKKPRNAPRPDWAFHQGTLPRQAPEYEPCGGEQYHQCDDAVGRRHGEDYRIRFTSTEKHDQSTAWNQAPAGLRT